MPEEIKEAEVKETEVPPPETPKPDDPIYEQTFDGQTVKLTAEQLNRVVYLGLVKASEMNNPTKETPKETPKEVPVENAAKETNKEYLELKGELEKRDQRQILSDVEDAFEGKEIEPYFEKSLKQQAFIAVATAKQKGEVFSTKKICKQLLAEHTKTMEKYKPKVDVSEKEKDKEKTKFAGGGKHAGQDAPPSLGRRSFKDGSLIKKVAERLDKLGE